MQFLRFLRQTRPSVMEQPVLIREVRRRNTASRRTCAAATEKTTTTTDDGADVTEQSRKRKKASVADSPVAWRSHAAAALKKKGMPEQAREIGEWTKYWPDAENGNYYRGCLDGQKKRGRKVGTLKSDFKDKPTETCAVTAAGLVPRAACLRPAGRSPSIRELQQDLAKKTKEADRLLQDNIALTTTVNSLKDQLKSAGAANAALSDPKATLKTTTCSPFPVLLLSVTALGKWHYSCQAKTIPTARPTARPSSRAWGRQPRRLLVLCRL
mmetsp:Transcript_33782/g.107942  ORF Transcript_33782/g.107942 Transcript_33782/m.107942 type:complete len:269 (-) Transcript_33782:2195-3001(-)